MERLLEMFLNLFFVIRTLSVQANYTVIFLSGRKSLRGIPRLNNRKCWVGFGTRFRLLHTSVTLRDLSNGNITTPISLLRSCSRIMALVNLLLSLFTRPFLLAYDQGLFPLWVNGGLCYATTSCPSLDSGTWQATSLSRCQIFESMDGR